MVGGVIITHGGLAGALVEVARSIAGDLEDVAAIGIKSGDTTDGIRKTLAKAVKAADTGDGVIIFTDMFGGTPTNVALSLLEEGVVEIMTGVNLPVVLKFAGNRKDKGLKELLLLLREHASKSVVLASDMLKAAGNEGEKKKSKNPGRGTKG